VLVAALGALGYYFDYSPESSQYVYVDSDDDGTYLARARSDGTGVTRLLRLSEREWDSVGGISWK
jgi:hypothetical protein